MTILIVDDYEENRYQLQVLLDTNHYQVVTTAHGVEALAKARQHPPDLIISDILMPVMDGFALCREWMKDERLKAVPFVFYTATYTDDRDRDFALGLGAARFIVKPEDPEVFVAIIREVLANHDEGGLVASQPSVEEEAVYLKQYNETLIRKLEAKMQQLERTNHELQQDIAARKQAEVELRRVDRALRTISECNQMLVRATDEDELLGQICHVVVEHGGYRLAWVGYAEADAARSVRPVAQAGFEEGYLQTIKVTWDDGDFGRGPTGTAIRTGQVCLIRDISRDSAFARYRAEAINRGYASELVLPLREDGRTFGALSIYASEPDAFDPEEVRLLTELAENLAYGIVTLRVRAEHKRANTALRESEEKFRVLFETSRDAIMILDRRGFFDCNNTTLDVFGCASKAQFVAKHPADFSPPRQSDGTDSRAAAQERIEAAYAQGSEFFAWLHQRLDGTVFPAEVLLSRFELHGQTALQAVVRDITERKRAEEALRLRDSALQASANAILITDSQGNILWANAALNVLTGYSKEEMLGQNPRLLKSGRQDKAFYEGLWNTILAGQVWQGEMINRHKSGHLYTEEATITPVRDANGQITHFICVKQDVTARKQAEENIRSQAELLDLAQDAIAVRDMNGCVRYWNKSCERLTGWTAVEAVGAPIIELLKPDRALFDRAGYWNKTIGAEISGLRGRTEAL